MNDVCATVGIENFKHLDKIVAQHRDNAAYYDKHLQDVEGVTLLERKGIPTFEEVKSDLKRIKKKQISITEEHLSKY